jgi:ribosomal protein S18 acetylase RimI-like enzyme
MGETGRSTGDGYEIGIRAINSMADFERSLDLLSLFFDGQIPDPDILRQGYQQACAYGYNQFIAETGEALVGSISIKPVYDPLEAGLVYEINHLIVARDYRRMGIGSALLEKCHSYARSNRAIGVRLLSYKHDEKAQAFYREKGYTGVCNLMIKPLQ